MWNPFRKKEKRESLEEILIKGGLSTDIVTLEQALNIPSFSACLELITTTIASLPILLYREQSGKVEIVKDDDRVRLLNDDTQDTLDGWQFKRAMVSDYLLRGASYAYINRTRNRVKSLHYVDNLHVGVHSFTDPIYKKYDILVNGEAFRDFEFVKMCRKSRDGVTGHGIIKEHNKLLSLVYNAIIYEETLVKTGGNKKGFLKSQGRLSKDAIDELKNAWNNLYKNNTESVVILNNGLEFQDASNTNTEMQLSENKQKNSDEICKLFLVPPRILTGEASDEEYFNWIKICIMPIVSAFESALNKELLLPSEKDNYYFSFDLNELLKGDIEKRFKAYEIGTKNGILQIDEVRYIENLPPLGLEFIKLGLQDVLYNPNTKEIYTPNTDKSATMGNSAESEGAADEGNASNTGFNQIQGQSSVSNQEG